MKRQWKPVARAAVLATLMCTTAWPAAAQYAHSLNPGMTFKSPFAALADFRMHQLMQRSVQTKVLLARLEWPGEGPLRVNSQRPPARTVMQVHHHPLLATDFRPTGERRVAEDMVAALAAPAHRAKALASSREQTSTIESLPGSRRNNLACARTLFVGLNLQALKGQAFGDPQGNALPQELNDTLVASSVMAQLDDRRRTDAYETWLISTTLLAGETQAAIASGDPDRIDAAKALAHSALAGIGLQL
ncbi:hypothetical protein BurJ1DRAFT_0898 [Burkholderiales bacterium JOSHI_001]|nr:hypothetical protein BurJ1DRAFT_0898 [Burkholderiales bacterium JOSHI_001]